MAHTRKVALLALADGFAFVRDQSHGCPPQDALAATMKAVEDLLNASGHGTRPAVDLVHARFVGWDALSIANDELRRLKDVEHHRVFLQHEYRVAASFPAALAREPGLTCAEHERRTPFVAPTT